MSPIYRGTKPVTEIYRGTNRVIEVRRGTELVWQFGPPPVLTDAKVETFSGERIQWDDSSPSVPKPAGTEAGDILIFIFATDYTTNNTAPAPPPGFTQLTYNSYGTTSPRTLTAYKRAGGSEPSSYVFTKTPSGDAYASMIRISGASATINPTASQANAASSKTSYQVPSTTPPSERGLHLIVAGKGGASNSTFSWNAPSGFTKHLEESASGWVSYMAASRTWNSGSDTGTHTVTLSTSSTASTGLMSSIVIPSA